MPLAVLDGTSDCRVSSRKAQPRLIANANNAAAKRGSQLHRERHFPEQRSAAIMLVAASDAPPTRLPQPIRIVARPILGGKTGEALPAQEILLTVAAGKKQAGASPQAANSP